MRIITKIFWGILLTISGYIAYYKGYINKLYSHKLTTTPTIKTIHPTYKDIVHKKVFYGNLAPYKEMEIYSNIPGIVEKLFVKVGDYIQKGTPIAQVIQKHTIKAFEEAERNVRLSSIELEQIKKKHFRKVHLFKKKMLHKEDYEHSLAEFNKASEALSSAKKSLQALKLGYVKEKGIGSTIIKSTTKGTILDIAVKEGHSVLEQNRGGRIALIGDMDRFLFTAQVRELDVIHLKKGMSFTISLNALKNEKFRVTLTNISPIATKSTNNNEYFSIEGIVALPPKYKSQQILRGGYSALAEVAIDQVNDVLAIPENLIQTEEQSYFVWCLSENKKVKKYIKLGLSDGLYAEVKEGITEEDLLIVEDE